MYMEKGDARYEKHQKQLKRNGFSDSETWSLDSVICQFVLPRLKRFKELNNGFPGGYDGMTAKKWDAILDEMIFAFDWSLTCEDKYDDMTEEEKKKNWKRHEEGLQLFAKWFRHLWW